MKVLLTIEAIYDVADIVDYIEEEFGEERALQFELDIHQRFDRLGDYVHAETGIRYNGLPIRKDVFAPSLIFFVVVDDTIHVLRVLREERDWREVLRRKQRYDYP